jgi:hypothetical protein
MHAIEIRKIFVRHERRHDLAAIDKIEPAPYRAPHAAIRRLRERRECVLHGEGIDPCRPYLKTNARRFVEAWRGSSLVASLAQCGEMLGE